ncbi:MAG: hypothetical protein BWZ10_01680 [candidate division BRC1 bacterium ADurb.BinA364]|nr:MAG: hypothetical protein BWZ10_01680 [candidate division BRC1 bacterium ADurb.BinA364]
MPFALRAALALRTFPVVQTPQLALPCAWLSDTSPVAEMPIEPLFSATHPEAVAHSIPVLPLPRATHPDSAPPRKPTPPQPSAEQSISALVSARMPS